jgi:hypothetical protein
MRPCAHTCNRISALSPVQQLSAGNNDIHTPTTMTWRSPAAPADLPPSLPAQVMLCCWACWARARAPAPLVSPAGSQRWTSSCGGRQDRGRCSQAPTAAAVVARELVPPTTGVRGVGVRRPGVTRHRPWAPCQAERRASAGRRPPPPPRSRRRRARQQFHTAPRGDRRVICW